MRRGDEVVLGQAFHAVAGDPGIAGRGEHLGTARAAQQSADERMLPPTPSNDQDPAQSEAMKSSTGIADSVS